MALEPVDVAPKVDDYTALSDHQEETPNTFFGSRAVLYLHSPKAKIIVPKSQYEETPVLKKLRDDAAEPIEAEGFDDIVLTNIDVWVSSQNLILFSPSNAGVSISYPSIALHALGTHESTHLPDGAAQVVFLQINIHDPETVNSDDEIHTLDLSIHVTETSPSAQPADTPVELVKVLFEALSTCADLHPDPQSSGSEEEDTAPGAGGWITSENMNDFVDADGNFTGLGSLGPGAGTVRVRDETQDEAVNGTEDDEETKWQRTD